MYFGILVMMTGKSFLQLLERLVPVLHISSAWNWMRFLLLGGLVFLGLWGVYVVSGLRLHQNRPAAPGAFAGTVGIVLMSGIFSAFIAVSTRYPLVYGSLASIILLNIVAGLKREGSSLSEAIGQIVRYRNSGEINYRVEDKSGAMDAVKEHFMSQEQATAFMDFDGYRVEFQDWWFNIRPSNTEPYLRFICEATSEALLQEKIAQTDAILAERFGGKR